MTSSRQNPPPALPESTLLRLETQLDSLDAILAGATEQKLARRPANGKWSARDQLAHLGRYHEVFLERLDRILAEDSPQLGRYRTEDDPGAAPWFTMSAADILGQIRELRARLFERLKELSPEDLRRAGIHPAFGEMPLALWIEFFLAHEGHHLYTIMKLAREKS